MKKNGKNTLIREVRTMDEGDHEGVASAIKRHLNKAAAQQKQVRIMTEGDFEGVASAREAHREKTKAAPSGREGL